MQDALSYMIERSRFDEQRLIARANRAAEVVDPRLVDEAAHALFACCYLQAHGTMFARAAAERRAASISRALRQADLEREVIVRLERMMQGMGAFFRLQ